MTFVPTIDPQDKLAPDYAGTRRVERWTATAAASDIGPQTITARHLQKIDDFIIDAFGGTVPSSAAVVPAGGNKLLLYLPGTTSATTYRIKLFSRY